MTEKRSLESLFDEVVAIDSPEARERFLHDHCAGDEKLQAQLRQMLRSDAENNSFLEQLPEALAGESGLGELENTIDLPQIMLPDTDLTRLEPLQRIDSPEMPKSDPSNRYQLQGEIARGGMGAILKGRDTDLGRDLAIKVLLEEHKQRPEVIQRFVEEAQIGGQLQHPGIAPVHELGVLPDKRPFFAMKLVKGQTLAKLLAERSDPSEDRSKFIGIFEQVCQTVGYAHARGVIHRDLKPANVMVGAFGEIQLMDWGLAKVLQQGGVADEKQALAKQREEITVLKTRRSTGSDVPGLGSGSGSGSADTQMGSVMGTPAYMAPEQALGEIDRVERRSDVFGLGAILCEILTGKPPYTGEDTTAVFRLASRGKLDDAFERLDACGADSQLIAIAKSCLAAEPTARPANGGALAELITNHLESVETRLRNAEVERARESARVVEQKKRTRITMALAASMLAVLGLGIAGTSWQWSQAESARAEAVENERNEKEAKEQAIAAEQSARAGIDLVASVFEDLDPEEVANKDRTLQEMIVEKLDDAIAKLESGAIGNPVDVANLQVKLGKSLLALDEAKKALPLLETARATFEESRGLSDPATLESMHFLGNAYVADAQLEKVMPLRQQTYDLRKEHLGEKHEETLQSLVALSAGYSGGGDYALATVLAEEAVAALEQKLGPAAIKTLAAKEQLLNVFYAVASWKKMLEYSEATLELCKAEHGPDHPETQNFEGWVAYSKANVIGPEEGIEGIEQVIDSATTLLGPNHSYVLAWQNELIPLYFSTQQWTRAIELAEKVYKKRVTKLGQDHPQAIYSMFTLSSAYQRNRWTDKAMPLAKELVQCCDKLFGSDHPETWGARNFYAVQLGEAGRHQEALRLEVEKLAYDRRKLEPDNPITLSSLSNLTDTYNALEKYDEAIALAQEGLQLTEKNLGVGHVRTRRFIGSLTQSYKSLGQIRQALELVQEYVRRCEDEIGREDTRTQSYIRRLAYVLEESGQFEEAVALRKEVFENAGNDFLRRSYGIDLMKAYSWAGQSEQAHFLGSQLSAECRHSLDTDSLQLASGLAALGGALLEVEAYPEAETTQRECYEIRKREDTANSWAVSIARFKFGIALLGNQKIAEAEKHLAAAYANLNEDALESSVHGNEFRRTSSREVVENGLNDIIRLYRSYDQPAKADKLEAELNHRLQAWGREPRSGE